MYSLLVGVDNNIAIKINPTINYAEIAYRSADVLILSIFIIIVGENKRIPGR